MMCVDPTYHQLKKNRNHKTRTLSGDEFTHNIGLETELDRVEQSTSESKTWAIFAVIRGVDPYQTSLFGVPR